MRIPKTALVLVCMGAFLAVWSIRKTSGTIGPSKGNYGALAGCKNGQGGIAKGCNSLRK